LSTHPAALAFVTTPRPVAVSYGTQPFFGVNAFKFTNAQGTSKIGRYRIVPESGPAYVSDEEAARRPPNALADNLRASLEKGPVKFRLLVQVAAADDLTTDATKVWPDSRPMVELGEIAVTKALDTKKVENELLFLPTNVTSGIDVSDDPIINTRIEAYADRSAAVPNRSPDDHRIDACAGRVSPRTTVASLNVNRVPSPGGAGTACRSPR
jgi:catalase